MLMQCIVNYCHMEYQIDIASGRFTDSNAANNWKPFANYRLAKTLISKVLLAKQFIALNT